MNPLLVPVAVLGALVVMLLVVALLLWRRARRLGPGLDEIAEDVLKELYHLTRQGQVTRRADLMRVAGLRPDRFDAVWPELVRRGWAGGQPEALAILPAGERRAVDLIRAHRLWERYLAEHEGLPLASLHAEATRREHLTTPEQADELDARMGFPRFDPHGDPIPPRDGVAAGHATGVPLLRWPLHTPGIVAHVEDEPAALLAQMALLGITPGAQVEIDERTPGRLLVWSGRQRLPLSPAVAAQVFVVEAPSRALPLSEIEVGQAAVVAGFDQTGAQPGQWPAALVPGAVIAAIRLDPLGDPVVYQISGQEVALSRIQANRVLVERDSVRDAALPRRSWLAEELARLRELFVRYGSLAVVRRSLVFFGPAFVVSVGYMDPGNWGTDIEAGARFGYRLLWVILAANLMAILMQVLSAKLGIATGKSLPEVCRTHYPRWLSVGLWTTAELAILSTDLAEILGGAVGLNLLFGIPLLPAGVLAGAATTGILFLERYGFRKVEFAIIGLIAVIGFVYMAEVWLASPPWGQVLHGLLTPSLPIGASLVAVGIVGATVMPHNLYLHSSLIQTRVRPSDSVTRKRATLRLAIADAAVALNGAFFVNAAILVMSAAAFSGDRMADYSLASAHQTLVPVLGTFAAVAFAVALLASGLSSSTTATLAGQVVMKGFIDRHPAILWRRLVTLVPSLVVLACGVEPLRILILSQVSLSFQLPFAMVPLVLFTSNRAVMGEFANTRLVQVLAWLSTAVIIGLNGFLLSQVFAGSAG
jgi:manganese transport protein